MAVTGIVELSSVLHFSVPNNNLSEIRQHVLFFPGDSVDLPGSERCTAYLGASLENQTSLLASKFPHSAVWTVKPTRYWHDIFACYDSLLPSTLTEWGDPIGYSPKQTGKHLDDLVRAASSQVSRSLGTSWQHDALPIILAAFSKGGVVLNQLITELQSGTASSLWTRTKAVHFIDVGLNSPGSYVTQSSALSTLVGLRWLGSPISLNFHATPRQVLDPERRLVGEELDECLAQLRTAGGTPYHRLHYPGQPPSMEMHFQILEDFDARLS